MMRHTIVDFSCQKVHTLHGIEFDSFDCHAAWCLQQHSSLSSRLSICSRSNHCVLVQRSSQVVVSIRSFLIFRGCIYSWANWLVMVSTTVSASPCFEAILRLIASCEANKTLIIPLKNVSLFFCLSNLHAGGWVMLHIAINTLDL